MEAYLDVKRRSIKLRIDSLLEDEVSYELKKELNDFYFLWNELPKEKKRSELLKVTELIDRKKFCSAIYIYSFFSYYINDSKWMEEMLEMILNTSECNANTLYFLYWQINSYFFNYPECESERSKVLQWKLFQRICKMFAGQISGMKWIKETERDNELVVVITGQYVGAEYHGPSKTALDRCKTLIEVMHKKVLLINTAEVLSGVAQMSYYATGVQAYIKELCSHEYLKWNGLKIPFFQCENNMPNVDVLTLLVERLVKMKPKFIVEIGTGSILANLVSCCIPVLSIATGTASLCVSDTQCQATALNITDKERCILGQMGKDSQHIIPSLFTFGVREQKVRLSRSEIGLPEDKFLLVVVGTRLDREVDDAFMQMLLSVNGEKIGIVFVGLFEKYEVFYEKYPKLSEKMYCLGMCEELLAVFDVCDLYVNPIRLGGGTSAAEALLKGIPVVSVREGDVGAAAGEAFWVEDYFEMARLIDKYQKDEFFYEKQSELALKRAELLFDSDSEFVKVIKEFGNRMGEHYI